MAVTWFCSDPLAHCFAAAGRARAGGEIIRPTPARRSLFTGLSAIQSHAVHKSVNDSIPIRGCTARSMAAGHLLRPPPCGPKDALGPDLPPAPTEIVLPASADRLPAGNAGTAAGSSALKLTV